MSRNDGDGFVYFMQCESTLRVKIGFSTSPERRLSELNGSQAPTRIVLLVAIAGSKTDESALHRRFADARIDCLDGREWFHLTRDLQATIENFGGKPSGIPINTEREFQYDQQRLVENIEAIEGLVGDVLVLADRNFCRPGYRHRGTELSGKFLQDVARARAALKPLVKEVESERAKRVAAIVFGAETSDRAVA